ncbi:hypothetical protein [Zavarzinella formosa]|uniref:hypothetical protein n=1 Tax=Zavarzinella formosa TaxID=360055 RepID=UPI00037105EE|nr:hypothetical protein [Zavarzinella formosa]
MTKNLWPDFDIGQMPLSPKQIIEEAGAGLEEKTNGLVRFSYEGVVVQVNTVELTYALYSRKLQFHFPFLQVKFGITSHYPVTIVADKLPDMEAADEDNLIESLAKIFNAPSTIKTVQQLMALSKQ